MLNAIKAFCKENGIAYLANEPMSKHTSFKIGGEAECFLSVSSEEQAVRLFAELKKREVPYFVIGNGTNLLVSDRGIAGAVVSLAGLHTVTVTGRMITCGAGASLSALCLAARDHGLTGLEFAYGIPGTVGGALTMNAGAYGGEMKDVAVSARVIGPDGVLREIPAEKMELGYRESVFKRNGMIILSAAFLLEEGEREQITRKMNELMAKRKEKQPLEYPSAGSTFKRPEGYFAGALIEQCGLKGLRCGGAAVSEKHAGFVVNVGGATCEDVKTVICRVQEAVLQKNGVRLEPEVILIGR